jgi:hypothetical protein
LVQGTSQLVIQAGAAVFQRFAATGQQWSTARIAVMISGGI